VRSRPRWYPQGAAELAQAQQCLRDKPSWLRREHGKWVDTMIAGNLAYVAILLVEDRRMRERLAYLKTQGLCFFQTMTLMQFLSR
jgi:hypothetical protein